MHYTESLTNYGRNKTMEVTIGGKKIGAQNSIKVQTMCNTATNEVEETTRQIANVAKNTKCDIIRVTVPSMSDVENLKQIHNNLVSQGITIPLVADVHFNAAIAFECAKIVEKVRVNPGNFGHHDLACLTEEEFKAEGKLLEDTFRDFLKVCKEHGTAVRIGTNHGSLSKRILNRYGDTPEGMVESVMEFLRVAVQENFQNIAISLKSSNPTVAIRAARLMVKAMNDENMHYCLHLGVTEAGEGMEARIKSASGICPLLNDGIGDTIRVSLTEDPENELEPGLQIAEYMEYISDGAKLPEIPFFYDPYHYNKRKSAKIKGVGGDSTASVAIAISTEDELAKLASGINNLKEENHLPDMVICYSPDIVSKAKSLLRDITIYSAQESPIIYINEETDFGKLSEKELEGAILIAEPIHRDKTKALRYIFYKINNLSIANPVLLKCDGGQCDPRFATFAPAAECAGVFIDGFGDGVCLSANGNPMEATRMAFQILQISRLRISGTEYVSCPGCGRTMYDLQGTVKKIKEATRKYRNLKIAVMGCIVNGPGEMADADFGYVGMGKGKIALYKAGEVVKKGIPETEAVEELIKLIDNSH
ncbi:MAG: (E)-4-hydroxy-3-methylbut-2-enyl-diphosphate synthase [Bacteroidales bacterium]|nr:(E)-4-hydroxy-3-methylbut-2-enyl-diphosphate synthase [Bacteroidales bacterium]